MILPEFVHRIWEVDSLIYEATRSKVYAAKNIQTQVKVVIKVENPNHKCHLMGEYQIYKKIGSDRTGFLNMLYFDCSSDNAWIMVLEDGGKNVIDYAGKIHEDFLANIFVKIRSIARQSIRAISELHKLGYIHRDIKGANLLINDEGLVRLIDFGLSSEWKDSDGNHIERTKVNYFKGTSVYASLNAIQLYQVSRRDDLESLGYVLITLLTANLPWDSIRCRCLKDLPNFYKFRTKFTPEMIISESNLRKIQNPIFSVLEKYLHMVFEIEFEEDPNYDALVELFL
jgi:casein kinase 1 alpha